ncbi:MAG: flagellar hook-basal body complex protein FliE [Massilia sp.]
MNIGGIDSSRIESMMAQLKAAATRPGAGATGADAVGLAGSPLGAGALGPAPAGRANFADALKSSLEQVSNSQVKADQMGERFALGDDTVSLSDTMIAMQKANINFQATVQVRNKLVSAYHEIMNMQV